MGRPFFIKKGENLDLLYFLLTLLEIFFVFFNVACYFITFLQPPHTPLLWKRWKFNLFFLVLILFLLSVNGHFGVLSITHDNFAMHSNSGVLFEYGGSASHHVQMNIILVFYFFLYFSPLKMNFSYNWNGKTLKFSIYYCRIGHM